MLSRTTLCLALAALSGAAYAQQDIKANSPYSAYVQDGRGVIARNATGLCWRTGYWTPADAVAGCDKPLVPDCRSGEELVDNKCVKKAPVCGSNQRLEGGACVDIPAPPPPPVPPAPPKRCDFSATFSTDQTFAFNKAVLTPAAKARIDAEVLPKLDTCAKVDLIVITGHADKIGSQQYNQKLSEKRADAVASYLKSKGVATQIETMGMGKTQAIKACDDKLPRKQLIECLAPNRRVVIEGKGAAK
ncbi:OmpA family protein [Massilia sp. W12]|uniref:OmpA family protein n=1 Tax=Massilia sp. W12 TaxID=3126507 RepID=UPI0030D5D066